MYKCTCVCVCVCTYHLSRFAWFTVIGGVHASDWTPEDFVSVGNVVNVVLNTNKKRLQINAMLIKKETFFFGTVTSAYQYLNALQPPPHSITTVVSGTDTFSQQIGDQTMTQSPSKGQDDVAVGGMVRNSQSNTDILNKRFF